MKFSYLGNFKFRWCTEVFMTRTLEEVFGHEVVRLQEDEIDLESVVKAANESDIFIWTRTPGFLKFDGHEMLKRITVPTMAYHLDLYCAISREPMLDSDPFFRVNYLFQVDGDPGSMKKFKERGINAYWIKPGVFEKECYISSEKWPEEHEIVFVGSYNNYHKEWGHRKQLLDWLKETYQDRFTIYPNEKYPVVQAEELNKLFSSTKIVIGDSLCPEYKHQNYWSNRVPETVGRGGFLIHPRVGGLDRFFRDKKHLIYYEYGNFDQLKSLIDYYLVHDEERKRIQETGYRYVKDNETFTNRWNEIFKILKTEGVM